MNPLVIIGNGIAGTTVALEVRKLDPQRKIVIISEESLAFLSRPALMYVYMGDLQEKHLYPYEESFWLAQKFDRVFNRVTYIDVKSKSITLASGEKLNYGQLVIATGSVPRRLNVDGEQWDGVQGLYHLSDLKKMESRTKKIHTGVVLGGGLIGVELAEMLKVRGKQVVFVVRDDSFWSSILPKEESMLVTEHIQSHGIDLRLNTELSGLHGNELEGISAVSLSDGSTVNAQFVGVSIGVEPHVAFLENSGIAVDRGVLVDNQLRTNVEDIFAVGDCAQFRSPLPFRKSIEQVWYTGKMQGEFLAINICGQAKDYMPRLWWNSAKFFDLEYQTYGDVPAQCPKDQSDLFWRDPKAERCVRLRFKTNTEQLMGINLLGVRGRHLVAEAWIENRITISQVMSELGAFNFDPEFTPRFEAGLHEVYRKRFPDRECSRPKAKGLFALWSQRFKGAKR